MKIFVTVGSRLPMDRLVKVVDELLLDSVDHTAIAQIGNSPYLVNNCDFFQFCNQMEFDEYVRKADVIVSHAGMGNIFIAKKHKKPIIVMARRSELNEIVTDHQIATIKGFQKNNDIYVIEDKKDLENALEWARNWRPNKDQIENNQITSFLKEYFQQQSFTKVLAVSSSGGHWVQLRLLESVFEKTNAIYMTTNVNLDERVKNNKMIKVIDADIKRKFKLFFLGCQVLYYVVKVKPDVVISTGAAPGFFAIVFAKLLKKETIWIDSVANYEKLSISGKHARKFCNLFLVQWPHLSKSGDYKGKLM